MLIELAQRLRLKPVMLAVPLAGGLDGREVRLELVARLNDYEQMSLGVAVRIAGQIHPHGQATVIRL